MKVEDGAMTTVVSREHTLRRALVALAAFLAVAAAAHLADHALRGELVADKGLDPNWDHSGWPFTDRLSPFTPSLAIPILFLVGAALTARHRAWAGFWLVCGGVVTGVVALVHFVPGPRTETLAVIFRTYEHGGVGRVAGLLAATGAVVIAAALATLLALAVRARRLSGRW